MDFSTARTVGSGGGGGIELVTGPPIAASLIDIKTEATAAGASTNRGGATPSTALAASSGESSPPIPVITITGGGGGGSDHPASNNTNTTTANPTGTVTNTTGAGTGTTTGGGGSDDSVIYFVDDEFTSFFGVTAPSSSPQRSSFSSSLSSSKSSSPAKLKAKKAHQQRRSVSGLTEDIFSLETLHDLIHARWNRPSPAAAASNTSVTGAAPTATGAKKPAPPAGAAGGVGGGGGGGVLSSNSPSDGPKPFLLAVVQTRDKSRVQLSPTCWSYYDAYALNRLLYRRRPNGHPHDITHRYHRVCPITVINPCTNTEIINEVRYYSIDPPPPAPPVPAPAAALKHSSITNSSLITPASRTEGGGGGSDPSSAPPLPLFGAPQPSSPVVGPLAASPALAVLQNDTKASLAAASVDDKPPVKPTISGVLREYTARFIGTDYHFAHNSTVRQHFIDAACEPQDFLTVDIANSFAAAQAAGLGHNGGPGPNGGGGGFGGLFGGALPPPLFFNGPGAGAGAGAGGGPGGGGAAGGGGNGNGMIGAINFFAAGRPFIPVVDVPYWRGVAFGFIGAFYLLASFLTSLYALIGLAQGINSNSPTSSQWYWSFVPFLHFTVDRMISAMHRIREHKTAVIIKVLVWIAYFLFPTIVWPRSDLRYIWSRHLMDLFCPVWFVGFTTVYYLYMKRHQTLM